MKQTNFDDWDAVDLDEIMQTPIGKKDEASESTYSPQKLGFFISP